MFKDSEQFVLFTLAREGPSESPWFQGLPVTTLNCLPFGLRGLLARWNVSISEETAAQHRVRAVEECGLGTGRKK